MKRRFGLDLMRFFAIVFVVFGHSKFFLGAPLEQFGKNFHFLILGVEIFFVLSGFLIGGILIKSLNEDDSFLNIITFWKRRWFRTLPNYYLFLFINAVGFSLLTNSYDWNWQYLFFLQNFAWMQDGFFSVSWSLTVEEWFYLILPVVIFLFKGLGTKKAVLITAILIILLVMNSRISGAYSDIYQWNEELRLIVIYRLDSLMYGVFAAWVAFYYKRLFTEYWKQSTLIFILLMTITLYMRSSETIAGSRLFAAVFFPLSSIGIMFSLPFFCQIKPKRVNFFVITVTNISIWSYSLYLVHVPVLEVVKLLNGKMEGLLLVGQHGYFTFAGYWVVCIVSSSLIFKYFEMPMTRLRDVNWRAKLGSFKRKKGVG